MRNNPGTAGKKSIGTLGRMENKAGRQGAFSKEPKIIAAEHGLGVTQEPAEE